MKKVKIYLDTSVISHLEALDTLLLNYKNIKILSPAMFINMEEK